MQNLASLANLKAYLGSPANPIGASDDATLNRLIAAKSLAIMTYLSRPTLFKNAAVMKTTGNGGNALLLNQWPVISVTQLKIANVVIPQAADSVSAGWSLAPWDGFSPGSPQKLYLNGWIFGTPVAYGQAYLDGGSPYNSGFTRNQSLTSNPLDVEVNFITGYFVTDEAGTVPASTTYTITAAQTLGTWGQDEGVKIASTGAAMTKVTGAPASGQYSVSAGVYTFNAAQAGVGVLISYSYIPPAIEDACIQMVGETYSYKERIGQSTKNLGGQMTSGYRQNGMTPDIKQILNPFKRVMIQR